MMMNNNNKVLSNKDNKKVHNNLANKKNKSKLRMLVMFKLQRKKRMYHQ